MRLYRLLAIVVLFSLFMGGCVTIEVPTKYGTAKYQRWFTDQQIKGFKATIDPNTGMPIVQFDSQASMEEALNTLAGQVTDLSNLIMKMKMVEFGIQSDKYSSDIMNVPYNRNKPSW